MPINSNLRNQLGVIDTLINQIDDRIAALTEDTKRGSKPFLAVTNDQIKFLRHIRLVLGGPLHDNVPSANVSVLHPDQLRKAN